MRPTPLIKKSTRRVHPLLLLMCSLLFFLPAASHALGLGRLIVHSGLDERLNGEIEITAATAQDIKSLRAGLASRAEFEAAGIDRPPHLATIKYSPVTRPDGRSFLMLSTEQPVREPFLHFLIEVQWTGGRILREYTALLDPPHWVAARPTQVEPPVAGVAAPGSAGAPAPAPADHKYGPPEVDGRDIGAMPPGDEMAGADAHASGWANMVQYGPVTRGETLSRIVEKITADRSVSSEQAMLALLRANPRAFFGNNVNNLRTGHILTIPEREAVEGISRATAVRDIRAQHDAWREHRMKLSGAERAPTMVRAGDQPKGKAPPARAADTTAAGKAAGAPAGNLLEIVRETLGESKQPEGSGVSAPAARDDASGEQRKLRDKVATLEEALESRQLENKELRERVATLQEMVENTKRLIEIESRQAAIAQRGASDARTEPAAPADTRKPAAEAPAPAATPPAAKKPPPAPTAAPDIGFLEDLLANPVTLGMLGAVVVLGGIILLLYVRRRGQAKSEFAESILSGGTAGSIGEPVTAGGAAKGADASFLSEFSKGGMGNIHHTDEVDPIAEAEVYLAYGRDEQAEEILKEAMAKDPTRHELKLKLLEIYHQRNDLRAFETLAEELYAATEGKGGRIWDQVETIGRKMNPDNPMFRGGQAAADAASTRAAVAAVAPAPLMETAVPAPAPVASPFATPPPPPAEMSFDLDLAGDLGETHPEEVAAPPRGPGPGGSGAEAEKRTTIDFESPFPKGEAPAAGTVEQPWPSVAESGIAFEPPAMGSPAAVAEAGGPAGPAAPDWDEVATKLDLAKAYIDMGDADGARSILDEVMTEGTDLQKKQARELVAQIA